mmetsp:Transcript_34905/g.68940  ORF Transcript_34905/g.68940 Transcript_34905/m.68940 type:complete len:371 (+) Transcript_34905:25-1137(+)
MRADGRLSSVICPPPPTCRQMPSHSSKQVAKQIAGGTYETEKKIGAGCFGEVYLGKAAAGGRVAMKFEDANARGPQLEHEAQVLAMLAEPTRPQGVAELLHYGIEGRHRCMVIELLGKSLEDHMESEGGTFQAETAALVADQLLQRIEYLHSKCLVHRDIKPENFMFGLGPKRAHLYAIDFGLSKRYWSTAHVTMNRRLSLTGTARYASINAHEGCEQSRRDDLEAIGHMLFYFIRGKLPWSGLAAKTQEEKYRKICEKKRDTPLDSLCANFPDAFKEYLRTARMMEFKERPNYQGMRQLFANVRGKDSEGNQGHEFQWFVGKDLSDLEPLQYTQPRQPDDRGKEAVTKGSGSGGGGCAWLCGGKSKVRD